MEAQEQKQSNFENLLKPGLTSQFSHNYPGNYEISVKMPVFWHKRKLFLILLTLLQ